MLLSLPQTHQRKKQQSDAADDFHIRRTAWANFLGTSLVGASLLPSHEQGESADLALRSRKWKGSEIVPTPRVAIDAAGWDHLLLEYPRHLYHAACVQLATSYEVFLAELLHEVLRRNAEVLANDESKYTVREIVAVAGLEELLDQTIDRRVRSVMMKSYPDQVAWFERELHVGLHSRAAPMTLVDIHDFIELRHVIVHADGHASRAYIERTGHIPNRRLERMHSTPAIDFVELLGFSARLLMQVEFVDAAVADKWTTTRQEYESGESPD